MAAPTQRASSGRDDVSRILKLCRTELQQLNLNRLLSELEQKDIVSKGTANVLERKSASEKSNVLISVLQSRDEQDFKTFLEVVSNERDVTFQEPTQEFLTMVSIYPGYESYYCDVDSRMKEAVARDKNGLTHNFIQVGADIIFNVGRDGKTCYDPVHGITLHFPDDSLPHGIEEIKITVKVGFIDHDLGRSDMVISSATVSLQCVPSVTLAKDVFLEIPHSAPSADTSDLCFVKFKDATNCGEVYNGIFPIDHPYGVIMTNHFSSFVIVKGKRLFYSKSSLRKTLAHQKRYFCKLQSRSWHRYKKSRDHVDQSNSNLFWLGITKISTNNENDNTFSFMVAQYTPTGFYAIKEHSTKQRLEQWSSFTFASDKLTFHPQMAEDCGWMATIGGFYEIKKKEAEKMDDGCGKLRIPMVQYKLVPTQHELEIPSIAISVSGANKKIFYTLTIKSHFQASADRCEMLYNLSMHPVMEDEFLQQLAYQLPVWQPVAQILGLSDSDIEHIEYDVTASRGERAYKAFLQWMQKEGHYGATYDVLLQALCKATDVSDCKSITNAWWYAHQYLSDLAEQPITI